MPRIDKILNKYKDEQININNTVKKWLQIVVQKTLKWSPIIK